MSGIFAKIIETLQVKLDNNGHIDWELWYVDGSSVRAIRAAAGADKKAWNAIPTSQPTTHWDAQEAGLDRNSTWLLTTRELPLPSKSRPEKSTTRRGRSR